MQSSIGRAPSFSSSSRPPPPYATPGTAKPPPPRAAPAKHQQHQQNTEANRALARAKWAPVVGGHFLEPGPTNRLVLSLRSSVPAEVDFALQRLIQVSSAEPDLLRLSELPGLLDGLIGLIREYLERRQADWSSGIPPVGFAVGQEPREAVKRRAAEAALILRNLAPIKETTEVLLASKRVKKLICEVLEAGEGNGVEAEETTELRLYLLEVLEGIADKVPLALPGHAIVPDALEGDDADEDSRPAPLPEPLDSPAVRLFPLLVAFTRSPDRALILAAFRCLTVLSTNNKSDSVFALLTYDSVQPLPKPHPHPVQTAIELLPLADAELNVVILDFIYQHTTLSANAVLFSTRPELLSILRLICSKFHINGRHEDLMINLRVVPSVGKNYQDKLPKRHLPAQPSASSVELEPVSKQELATILHMPEPARCIEWMRLVFELDPSNDVQQVVFWQSYERLFQRYMAPGVPAMLSASQVIQHASDGHPQATPIVLENPPPAKREFVIRGLRQRARPDLHGEHRCRWVGCTASAVLVNPLETYHHLRDIHLSPSANTEVPSSCAWEGCTYTPSTSHTDPALRAADLSLHVRTHLPPLTSSSPTAPSDLSELPAILHHERHYAERDPASPTAGDMTAAGSSLLSVLILRNLSRTVKSAVEAKIASSSSGGSTASNGGNGSAAGGGGGATTSGSATAGVASGNAAIGRLAGDEQSIFEAFAAAAEGLAKKDGVLSRLEKIDPTLALPAIEALLSVQETLVRISMADASLGKVLSEVVQTIEACRRKVRKLEKVKEAKEAALLVKMQE